MFRYQAIENDPASLSGDRIYSLMQDRLGRIWVGTYEGGLNRIYPRTGLVEQIPTDPDGRFGPLGEQVSSLYEDENGIVWIGTDNGLTRWDPATQRFSSYVYSAADPFSLSNSKVTSVLVDRGGVLWVGTKVGGVNKWNGATITFDHIASEAETEAVGLSNPVVTSFQEEPNGALWVGTFGGGLNRFSADGTAVEYFRESESGLPSDLVMSLLLDRKGSLWVGTQREGLSRRNADGSWKQFRPNPDQANGLPRSRRDGAVRERRRRDLDQRVRTWPASLGQRRHRLRSVRA